MKMLWRCRCGKRVEKLTDDNFGNCGCPDPVYGPEYFYMTTECADMLDEMDNDASDSIKQLADARAEIKQLALEIENKQYTITCESEENQQLKESLAEAQAEIANLKWHINSEKAKAEATLTLNDRALELVNEVRAEIERKDKLIEQMREALSLVMEGAIHDFHYACQHRNSCLCWGCQKKRVNAALAAERGGE